MKRSAVTPSQLAQLSRYSVPADAMTLCQLIQCGPGELLCQDDQQADMLYFLLQGRAKVLIPGENGEQLILCFYDGFGVVDDMELFLRDGRYHVSCEAITELTAIGIPLQQNREALLASNYFLQQTCTSFALSLQRNRNHFQNLLYSAEERLCSYIVQSQCGGLWKENLTQTAELLGISYRHLLRVLHGLCEKNILRRAESHYIIQNMPQLRQLNRGFFAPVESCCLAEEI